MGSNKVNNTHIKRNLYNRMKLLKQMDFANSSIEFTQFLLIKQNNFFVFQTQKSQQLMVLSSNCINKKKYFQLYQKSFRRHLLTNHIDRSIQQNHQKSSMKIQTSQDNPSQNKSASLTPNSQQMNSINSQMSLSASNEPRKIQFNARPQSLHQSQEQSRLSFTEKQMKTQDNYKLGNSLRAKVNFTVDGSQSQPQGSEEKNLQNSGEGKETSDKYCHNSMSFHSSKQSNGSQILKTSQEKHKLINNTQIQPERQEKYGNLLQCMTRSLQQSSISEKGQNSLLNQQTNKPKEKQEFKEFKENQLQYAREITKIDKNSYTQQQVSQIVIKQNSNATIEKILIEIEEQKKFEQFFSNINENTNQKSFEKNTQLLTDNSTNQLLDTSDIDLQKDSGFQFQFGNKDITQGQYFKAIEHFQNAIKLHKQKPTNIENYVKLLINAAEAYYFVSNYSKSEQKCQQILKLQIQKDLKWELLVNFYHVYARCLCYLKKQQLALKYSKLVLQITDRQSGIIDIRIMKTYEIMGAAYACQQNFTLAIEYYGKFFQLAKQSNNNSEISKTCLQALFGLGFCYNYMGQHEKDLQNNLKILKISEQLLHKDNMCFPSLFSDIGLSYTHLKKHAEADIYLRKAQQKLKELNVQQRLQNAFLIFNYCLLQKSKGNYLKALTHLDQSQNILKQKLAPEHFYVNQAQKQRETILELMKNNPKLAQTDN